MNGEVEPIVGNWYRSVDKGQTFTVVGVDEDEGIIEIQYADGDIEEIETLAWEDMELEVVDEPDDWRGALDDVDEDEDDLDYDDDEDDEDDEDEDDEDDWGGSDGDDWED